MAVVFPNSPVGALPFAVLRTFNFMKGLPEGYRVWHHLAPWQQSAPDFFILNARGQALLVKVSPAAPADARPAAQLLLLEDERLPLGQEEEDSLAAFMQALQAAGGLPEGSILPAVLFPNLSARQVAESRPPGHTEKPLWLGREFLQPESLPAWAGLFNSPALGGPAVEHIRRQFTPEVVVPTAITVRQPTQRQLEAGLTGFLLDYDQEAALKTDLDLPVDGQSVSKDFRLSLVNGVAGSGKTLILLYRLRLLQALFPGRRFLVLTHNRPLIHDMQSRFHRLCGLLPEEISWNTFNSWCRHHWPEDRAWPEPVGRERRQGFIRAIWHALFKDTNITDGMLRAEIDWIKDQVDFDQEAYLRAERRGRGFRLSEEQRQRVYTAFERYQDVLRQRRLVDWSDVPRLLLGFIQEGHIRPEQYDAVLVDEAQFFAPLWFELLRCLVKPHSGHLFLEADPTQGFLRQGTSWKSMGLDVRGHSIHLRRSYRTTQEILTFATLVYRQRVPRDEEAGDILAPDLLDMPGGAVPYLIQLGASQDEIARVANEVAALVKRGVPPQDILVLHTHWQGAEALIQSLRRRLGRGAAADPKNDYPGNYVRVTTLNAGTGLEGSIVFLAGLHALFEEEHSLRLSDEEREQVILENTRKIYMAITRAGQRLVFTYVGNLPESFKDLFSNGPG